MEAIDTRFTIRYRFTVCSDTINTVFLLITCSSKSMSTYSYSGKFFYLKGMIYTTLKLRSNNTSAHEQFNIFFKLKPSYAVRITTTLQSIEHLLVYPIFSSLVTPSQK